VAEATNGGYQLINTDELRPRHERDPRSILLVDTRQDWEFAMGHIAGEITPKPRPEYQSAEWAATDLPCAPAIMIGEEVVVEGSDIAEDKVVAAIRQGLGMSTV